MSRTFVPIELRERSPDAMEEIMYHRQKLDGFWSAVHSSVSRSAGAAQRHEMDPEEVLRRRKKKAGLKRRSSLRVNIEKMLYSEEVSNSNTNKNRIRNRLEYYGIAWSGTYIYIYV